MPTKEIEVAVKKWNKKGYNANGNLHNVVLETNGLQSFGTSIELDGFKIKGLRDVSLDAPLGDAPVVTISFVPGQLRLESTIPDFPGMSIDDLAERVREWVRQEMRGQ